MGSASWAGDFVASYQFAVGVEHRQVLLTARDRQIEHRRHVTVDVSFGQLDRAS